MPTQAQKAETFRGLHQRPRPFIIPNPYDIGTTRILESLGFEALATTSAGFALSIGKEDNTVGRDAMMAHVRAIVEATSLPVSADLENGFGDDPKTVAETIRMAAGAGLAGCSIEDGTGRVDEPVYELAHAVDRIRAAVEAARAQSAYFTLTARAENHIVGRPNLSDTITRLQAYQEAGADVLYAPGLARREDIAALVNSVDLPVNVLMGRGGFVLSLPELTELGVRRISVGGILARAALGAVIRAAREMSEKGTFEFAFAAAPYDEIVSLL